MSGGVLMAEKVTKGSHTPGPWSVEDPIDSELCIVEANKPTHEWKFIATIYLRQGNDRDEFPHAVSEANARLIAAAPDLLEAARAGLAIIMKYGDGNWGETEKLVRAAIAKAEGK